MIKKASIIEKVLKLVLKALFYHRFEISDTIYKNHEL